MTDEKKKPSPTATTQAGELAEGATATIDTRTTDGRRLLADVTREAGKGVKLRVRITLPVETEVVIDVNTHTPLAAAVQQASGGDPVPADDKEQR